MIRAKLEDFELLQGLDETDLQRLRNQLRIQTAQKGDILIHKGSPSRHLYFLFSGLVNIVDFDDEGNATWIATIEPGHIFGELGLILETTRSADAVAIETAEFARLPREEAMKLLTQNPTVAQRMLQQLARTIKQQNQHLHMLNRPSAEERLKALLMMKAKHYASGLVAVENLPSQAQLASMANTSRETVSRTLARWCREGIIEKDYKRLIIRRPEALQS
ncbi:cAMP-binding domain of CRP or a regulatory subunit of cAMP-dependent protein kinases [Sulfurivirga caldicuralii]|uniref:cAMP-binding domain of CRP or a regulatory subunit of cAMP-dependent protein kinases n=1 Tax=Sulfurivirga caldicuralii TaxID=364032 RepID=A0A1N6H5Y1_9GAMM|nr:Crp/Fnr family transcriptional regulator [Sulfurivirga caldicuralii]SIO15184.1 cAMP-binding domain of CRP or a regulatory subunit of cAMP-dependent protein kinases [Sulfurivirga caldicuralii]